MHLNNVSDPEAGLTESRSGSRLFGEFGSKPSFFNDQKLKTFTVEKSIKK
jgi:hypothetical protein